MLETSSAGHPAPANAIGLSYQKKFDARSWPAERVHRMRALRDAGKRYSEIADILGVTKSAISGQFRQLRNHGLDVGTVPERPDDTPADFSATAAGKTIKEIAAHYGVSCSCARKWRRRAGIRVKGIPIPEGFAAIASDGELSSFDLARRYSVSVETVRRWRDACGVAQPRRQNFIIRHPGTNMHDPHRDPSLAGRAVDECLRRISGMHRCDADGTPNPKGIYWDRGGHVLTDEEVIERARARGWNPDKWKELAK